MTASVSTIQVPGHIIHSSRFFYVVTDASGHCLAANEHFTRKFNAVNQQSFPEAFNKSISPAYHDKFHSILQERTQQSVYAVELVHELPDGSTCALYWETSAMDGKDEHGILQWTGISLENTQPSASAIVTPERYNAYEYSAEGIWRVDLTIPVSITISPEDIIEHCKEHAMLAECNDNMARMYGFAKAEELTGRKITDLMDLCKQETWRLFILNGFHSSNIETREFDRNGNTLFFLNNMTGIVENGFLLRVWGTQQDITEKRKAAEQIRQSELFFRALIADSLDGILLVNEKGTISFSSESVSNILGYEPEDLIGNNSFAYVHPDDMELCISAFQDELQQAPQKKFIGIRLLQKSGEWLCCMVRGHNLLSNPAVGKVLIYFCDDTFRRNAEAALIESRERFLHLIQNLNVGVILVDAGGYILLCNQSCLEIFKAGREEDLVGTSVFDSSYLLIDDDNRIISLDEYPIAQAIATKNVIRNRIVGVDKNNRGVFTWLHINAQPVLEADQSIKHIVCSFIDITEQRNLEQQIKQQEALRQKQLMQATIDGQERERSDISRELHDNISQHLTTTRLYLEVAKDKTEGQLLEMILQAHKGLMYISSEMRRLSQSLAPPELRDIGLVESIRDLCDLLKNLHAFKLEFKHDPFNESKITDAMKLMLFRIIQEQVNNIIRHANARKIRISLLADTSEVRLSVSDDGKGYDPKLIKKGLGLTNIINRVGLFDGNVEIITSPGEGCFLQVRIPLK